MNYKMDLPFKSAQLGFSLVEVLVAMLIAAVAVGGTMLIHAQNLRQVTDNADLNRAELILTNAVKRMQTNRQGLIGNSYNGSWGAANINSANCQQNAPCPPAVWAATHDLPELRTQLVDAGLNAASFEIVGSTKPNTWLVMIQWPAHDANHTVWRSACGNAVAGQNCVGLEVTP